MKIPGTDLDLLKDTLYEKAVRESLVKLNYASCKATSEKKEEFPHESEEKKKELNVTSSRIQIRQNVYPKPNIVAHC
jgi:hypothetical protein